MNKKAIALIAISIIGVLILGISTVLKKDSFEKTQTVVKIGALLPLTGKFANIGEDLKNGLELARKEIRDREAIDFEIVYEDSGADAKISLLAAQKLINVDKVDIIIGGVGSSASLAVAPMMNQNKVAFLTMVASPSLNTAGEYIFKIHPDIDGEVIRTAGHMYKKGYRNIAFIYDSSADSNVLGRDIFIKEFERLGGGEVFTEGYDAKTVTDFRSTFTKLKDRNPDAYYFLAIEKNAGFGLRNASDVGVDKQVYGWSPIEGEEFLNGAGAAAEGVILTAFPFSCEGTDMMKDYCEEYMAMFDGRKPMFYSAHMYDILNILASIIADDPSNVLDAERVKKAFTNVFYQGISGEFNFDAEGNIRDKDFVFKVVKDGKFVKLEE